MLSRATAAILGALLLSAACTKSEGGDAFGSASAPRGSGSGAAPAGSGGSAGGFSADLAKEIGSGAKPEASAAAKKPPAGAKVEPPPAGGKVEGPPAKPGSAAGVPAAPPAAKVELTPAQDPLAKIELAPAPPKVEPPAVGPAPAAPAGKPGRAVPHGPVKVPADLAAIKLSLLPNWDRDVDEPGTFQYVVRIKGTQSTKTFTFHYGYDDPKAPNDREQYKKFLQDSKTLVGDLKDRQRGSAWFLEGAAPSGQPAFRYMVLYGGKRLICYGSLYKDADSNRLGDDRDQTVIQAKQICETLAL
jgi:hypothetical protein